MQCDSTGPQLFKDITRLLTNESGSLDMEQTYIQNWLNDPKYSYAAYVKINYLKNAAKNTSQRNYKN